MSFITIPNNFGRRYDEHDPTKNVMLAIRECHANAGTYDATKALAYVVFLNGNDYLLYLHDGKPFEDINEIIEKGVTPNVTNAKGDSFQGCGLCMAASELHRKHELIIASRQDDSWVVGRGWSDRADGREWHREDITRSWMPKIRQVVGAQLLREYNVLYMMRLDTEAYRKRHASKMANRSFLHTRDMVPLPFFLDGFKTVKLSFGDNEVGHPSSQDASVHDALRSGRGGHVRNLVYTRKDYEQMYLGEWNGQLAKYKIPCEPFRVYLQRSPEEYIEVTKANVVICMYPGTRANDSTNWMVTLRDVMSEASGRTAAKGGTRYPGKKPVDTTFIKMPFLYNGDSARRRFLTNPLFTSNATADCMSALGLPYSEGGNQKAFVTIDVEIEEVNPKKYVVAGPIVHTDDSSAMEIADLTFNLEADFTLRNRSACKELLKSACLAAATGVPEDCKKYAAELFPPNIQDLMPIGMGGPGGLRPRSAHPFVVYNIRTGDKFDGNFTTDSTSYLAIFDKRRGKFLKSNEIGIPNIGVSASDVSDVRILGGRRLIYTASIEKIKEATEADPRILCILIEEAKHEGRPLASIADWQPGDSPSPRRVKAVISGIAFTLGHITDIPVVPRATDRRTPTTGGGTNPTAFLPYCDAPEDILLRYNDTSKRVDLNKNHPWVREFFIGKDASNAKIRSYCNRLYHEIKTIVLAVVEPLKEIEVNASSVADPEKGYHDNSWDYVINKAVEKLVNTHPSMIDICGKLREEFETGLPAEAEAASA